MAGLGSGIGGFLDGFVKGAEARRRINKDASDNELTRERLGLLKNADARAADENRRAQESHGLSLKAKQAELDEFNAGALVREAERRRRLAEEGNKLGAAEDQSTIRETRRSGMAAAEKEQSELVGKSIMNTTDAEGRPTFSMDGEVFATREAALKRFEAKNGTVLDRFRSKFAPAVEQKLVESGDTKTAAEWNAWVRDGKVGKAIEDIGRAQTAIHIGDWEKATRHINEVINNGGYVPQTGFKAKVEPVMKDGKAVGARVSYTSPDGTTETKEFNSLGEFGQQFAMIAAPTEMFRHQKMLFDQANASKAKMAEKNNDTANDIIKENNKSDNAIDMKRFESALKANEAKYGPADPKEIFDAMKKLSETDDKFFMKKDAGGKDVPMTLDEAVEKTLAATANIRARGARAAPQQAAPAAMPQRMLMSRPTAPQQQPTPTQLGVPTPQAPRPVVPRSVLPAMTQYPIQGH